MKREKNEKIATAEASAQGKAPRANDILSLKSHEIRTPLNSILGFLSLLKGSDLSPDQKEYVNIIEGASESLLLLINDILDISKIESGSLELEPGPFNLFDLLEEVGEVFSTRARIKGLEYSWQIGRETPLNLRGDSVRLRQVLFNLLDNAVKFTGRGGVRLSVEQRGVSAREVTLGFSVEDTGVGLSDNEREKIFDCLPRCGAGSEQVSGGSGLGLYASRKIIELMGGKIGVKKNSGGCSVFHFSVDLEMGVNSERVKPSSGEPCSGKLPSINSESAPLEEPKHLLLAEDNRNNQIIVQKYLGRCNYQLHLVSNGEEAVAAVKIRRFDLILMDLNMPVMDGFQATREIRELEFGRGVPVVALTARIFSEDIEACREAGMDDFITKPITMKGLIEKLSEIFKRGDDARLHKT